MTTIVTIICCDCRMPIYVDKGTQDLLVSSLQSFYCLNGHRQAYSKQPSEADKLRNERDRLKQKLAEKDDLIADAWATATQQAERAKTAERQASAYKGVTTRLKKRAANGVCPCCNRTFVDLQRHMAGQHPGFAATDEVAA